LAVSADPARWRGAAGQNHRHVSIGGGCGRVAHGNSPVRPDRGRFRSPGPYLQAVIDSLGQRRSPSQRIVPGPVGGIGRGSLDMSAERRLIDLRIMPPEPPGDVAAAERLVELADTFVKHRH